MDAFDARYNDGITAKTRAVRVEIVGAGLSMRSAEGDLLDEWPAQDIRLIERPGTPGPIRLGCGEHDLARLTIDDHSVLPVLVTAFPALKRQHRIGLRTVLKVGGWTIAAAASVVLLVQVIIPQLAVQLAAIVPQSVQTRIGSQVADQLIWALAKLGGKRVADMACTAPAGIRAMEALENSLSQHVPGDIDFQVQTVDAGLVNAFALPGGHILVTRGMIELADNPEALAGVLAHEMGHVVERHPTEVMIKVATTSFLLGMVVGDIAGGTVLVALGSAMIRASYTQEAEREADRIAVELLNATNIDGRPLTTLFEKLLKMKEGGVELPEMFATHPPTTERMAGIRGAAVGLGSALDAGQWQALRKICG